MMRRRPAAGRAVLLLSASGTGFQSLHRAARTAACVARFCRSGNATGDSDQAPGRAARAIIYLETGGWRPEVESREAVFPSLPAACNQPTRNRYSDTPIFRYSDIP